MATLEKIRSKSTLLLIVVGVALFLFIIMGSERVFASFFGPGSTIAEVDGQKIDIQEFQRRMEDASKQAQARGQKIDQADLQSQVLSEMLTEALFDKEVSKLGLVVTDEELTGFMFGDGAKLADGQVAQMTGGQLSSAQELYDMAFNPAKYNMDNAQAAQLQQMWLEFEKNMEKQLLQTKFMTLFNGALVANELDAKAIFDDNTRVSHIAYAKQDYSTLADDDYAVTKEEVKAEWERTKNRYMINEENRTISYISVDIQPSATDRQAAQKKVEDAVAALRGAEGAQGLADNSEFVVSTQKIARNKVRDPQLKNFLDSAMVGGTKVVSQNGNDYLIAKLLGTTSAVDSININFLAVEGKAALDSLLAGLKSGALTFAAAQQNQAVQNAQDSLWISALDAQLEPALKAQLLDAATGTYFTVDTAANAQQGRIFCVNSRKAAVPVVEFVTAQFTATPSNATVNNLLSDLNKFIAENNTAETFKANGAAAHYNVQEDVITPSSVRVGNVKDSRQAVRWALKDGKKGQVSPVFGNEETGTYVVVAINDIYKDKFVPYTDPTVYSSIESYLRNQKKGDALVEKYAGKASNLEGYAKLMNVQVDSTQVVFAQNMIPKFNGPEPKLAANVANAQVNKVVAPVKGNDGVVAFVVTSVDESSTPYNYEDAAARFNQTRGGMGLSRSLERILLGRNKVKNNSLHFFRD